jgi:MFS family permease
LTEAPRPESIRDNPRAPWLAVGVVCFGAFMGQLDASIVTLTFRPMERGFGAPLAAVQWVSLAYLLVLVALVTPAGRLADGVGRKLIYIYGFVVFTLGSAGCGLAPSLTVLILCRQLQADGAAMLQANSVALVTTSVPLSWSSCPAWPRILRSDPVSWPASSGWRPARLRHWQTAWPRWAWSCGRAAR